MVVGIVLAAGLSTRMGNFKQLLPFAGQTVVQHVVDLVKSQLDDVVVVLGHRASEVVGVLDKHRVRSVVNRNYAKGMTTSVQCGIAAALEADGYLICLGDQPGITIEVISHVITAAKNEKKSIVIPTYNGKRGHPVYIGKPYVDEILALPVDRGLNMVTRGHPEDTLELPLTQREILDDMDTPADYQRELARREKAEKNKWKI